MRDERGLNEFGFDQIFKQNHLDHTQIAGFGMTNGKPMLGTLGKQIFSISNLLIGVLQEMFDRLIDCVACKGPFKTDFLPLIRDCL